MITVEELRSIDAWRSLESHWRFLLVATDNRSPFMTWEWLDSWAQCYANDKSVQILVCRDGYDVLAILPLIATTRLQNRVVVRTLKLLGNGMSDRLTILATPKRIDAISAIAKWLKLNSDTWDLLAFADLFSEDPNSRELHKQLNYFGIPAVFRESVRCPYVSIGTDWSTFYSERFGKKTRTSNRVKLRKLGELGRISFRWVVNPNEYEEALDAIRQMDERTHYHGTIRNRPFDSSIGRRFFLDAGMRFAKNGWLFLGLLELDNSVVAYRFNFRFQARHFDYFPGFSPDYFRFSAGRLLMKEIMEDCFKNDFQEVDFLRGVEPWKDEWTNLHRTNNTLSASNPRIGSRIRVLIQKIPRRG